MHAHLYVGRYESAASVVFLIKLKNRVNKMQDIYIYENLAGRKAVRQVTAADLKS